MPTLKNFIILNNDKFEVVELQQTPLNVVLTEPDNSTWTNHYILINNQVIVSWQDYYNDSRYKYLEVKYRKTTLLKMNGVKKAQIVIDALNKYKNISKAELETEYENAQKEEKSALELEIEELKEEKQKAIEEAKIYTDILKKGSELFTLLRELDSNKL